MTKTKSAQQILATAVYELGDVVFLRVAQERKPGIVTGLKLSELGVTYIVSWTGGDEHHYSLELTNEYIPDFNQ